MIVQRFNSGEIKEIEDPPANYDGCIYCYAASKTCNFYREGDTHFFRVESELREVVCVGKGNGQLSLKCRAVTEAEVRRMMREFPSYS